MRGRESSSRTELNSFLQQIRKIESVGDPTRWLSARLGISRAALEAISNGRWSPSLQLAFALEDVSGGAIPARGWLCKTSCTRPSHVLRVAR